MMMQLHICERLRMVGRTRHPTGTITPIHVVGGMESDVQILVSPLCESFLCLYSSSSQQNLSKSRVSFLINICRFDITFRTLASMNLIGGLTGDIGQLTELEIL